MSSADLDLRKNQDTNNNLTEWQTARSSTNLVLAWLCMTDVETLAEAGIGQGVDQAPFTWPLAVSSLTTNMDGLRGLPLFSN